MKLQDIKIGTKLAWGFGLLLVVMAMLIALAVVNLGAIYGDLDRIVRINNTRQSLAAAMTEIEREDAIAVRNAFLQRERVKEMIQRMDGNNKKHAEMFNQVEEMTAPDDSAGHALLSRVRETRNSSHALNMKTMEMMAQNMFDEAFRFYEKESRAAMRQSISAGDELIRHQTERSSTRYEASTGHYRRTKTSMLVLGGCALLLGIIMSVVLTRNIVRPLREGVAVANRLAGGDLSVRVEAERKDEMGQLLLAMKNMVVKLNRVIADVIAVSGSVFSGSRQLAAGAEQMAQGTTEQASSTQEASSTVEQMNATIRQNSDNAQQTEKISRMSAADADRSGKAVTDTVVAMKDIAGKIAVVDELARQTNLLALNAAIEAARAGEHGKGFAVVASEVRKLAERSQEAAAEICRLSSASMQIAENAGALLEKLVPDIGRTAELVQEISAASKEQAGGADQINAAIQQLNQVVQNNAGASEELAATAEELASQADQLTQTVAFFTVEREPMKAAQAPAPARSGSASKTTKTVSGGRSAEKMEWHAA